MKSKTRRISSCIAPNSKNLCFCHLAFLLLELFENNLQFILNTILSRSSQSYNPALLRWWKSVSVMAISLLLEKLTMSPAFRNRARTQIPSIA